MKILTSLLRSKYPALIWTASIFILCTLPSKNLPQKVNDKTAHFAVFALFTFLWLFSSKQKKWLILISAAAYGIAIEFWQGSLPESFHRGFDWYDALADAIGGIIGWIVWEFSKKIKLFHNI